MDDLKIGFGFLILNDDHTWRRASFEEWQSSGHDVSTQVALHSDTYAGKQIAISTVFIHIGPQLGGPFETMVFVDDKAGGTWRYETWDAAIKGHAYVIESLEKIIAGHSLSMQSQSTLSHAD